MSRRPAQDKPLTIDRFAEAISGESDLDYNLRRSLEEIWAKDPLIHNALLSHLLLKRGYSPKP